MLKAKGHVSQFTSVSPSAACFRVLFLVLTFLNFFWMYHKHVAHLSLYMYMYDVHRETHTHTPRTITVCNVFEHFLLDLRVALYVYKLLCGEASNSFPSIDRPIDERQAVVVRSGRQMHAF